MKWEQTFDFLGIAMRARLAAVRHGHSNGVSLGFLDRAGCYLTGDLHRVLSLLKPEARVGDIDEILRQAKLVVDSACRDTGSLIQPASPRWNIGDMTGLLLASMTLLFKPSLAVEVGVANGTSTRIILSAMYLNERGRLLSFDIDPRCAKVVSPELTPKWEFKLLPSGRINSMTELSRLVKQLGEVDLWFSDADHSFVWQRKEWGLAFSTLGSEGILIADDIDSTPAWPIVTGGNGSLAILDTRKVTGLMQKGRRFQVTT